MADLVSGFLHLMRSSTTTGSVGGPVKHSAGRILAFDGLRGVAALAVVVFHFFCLLWPTYVPTMASTSAAVTQTPIYVLWNGRFAVAVFFVLSGFVMAAAADRRGHGLLVSSVARYLRLALPATASCLLAWLWLQAFPEAAQTLEAALDEPSRWLRYTRQVEIGPIYHPVADGMIVNFVRGFSRFNNVLWTMKIELFGSLGIFVLYGLSTGLLRIGALLLGGGAVLLVLPDPYLAFVLGAGIYEAHRRGILRRLPPILPLAALCLGLLLGGMGPGSHETWGLPHVPERWQLGTEGGLGPGLRGRPPDLRGAYDPEAGQRPVHAGTHRAWAHLIRPLSRACSAPLHGRGLGLRRQRDPTPASRRPIPRGRADHGLGLHALD